MKKLLLSLTAVIGLAGAPAAGSSEEIMLEMIDYIVSETELEYNGEQLPFVIVKSIDEICQDMLSPSDYEIFSRGGYCNYAGYYDPTVRTIVVADEPVKYMVAEKYYETILVHELAHYLQYLNGADEHVQCRNELEADAYRIQNSWIDLKGYPEEQKTQGLFAKLNSMCGHP